MNAMAPKLPPALVRFPAIILAICLAFFAAASPGLCAREARILFRISVENSPEHIQTQTLRRFADALNQEAGDVLKVELHDSATLFRDADVFSAVTEGKVEMAVPGAWHIARYQPDVNIFLLPMFYGRSAKDNHAVLESPVGRELDRRIEDALGVHIPGKWLDLGHANLYTTDRELKSLGDVKGLRIRVAGGRANVMRLEAAGAKALTIAWPDFPLHLKLGEVDGVLTTNETIRSADLWEYGLKYCLRDQEYFPMYAPMISGRIWNMLSEKLRAIITEQWEKAADWERGAAANAQQEAQNDLVRHGMVFTIPDEREISQWRKRLSEHQDEIISKTGMDKGLYLQAVEILER